MPDRKSPPPFQKSNSFPLISPQTVLLSNGLRITLVPGGEQEVVKVEFIFKAGKWHESRAGISYFTAHLLSKGTSTKTSFQISTELDQYGMHLEVSPGYDFTSVALLGLTKNIDRFVALLHELITQPTFPETEVELAKGIYIQGLKINLEKTSYLASRELRKSLFGETHPYGRDAGVADIEKIQREQLQQFHREYFQDFEIILSGKISDSLTKTLSERFEEFGVFKKPPHAIDQKETIQQNLYQEKENTVQTSIRLGKRSISRTHPDYPALLLLNHIFGGFFGSRLMKNIREEKGLTYGIYSSFAALKHDSYLSIGADVNKENRELTIQEIKNELKKLQTGLIGREELETAKNHFIGSLQAEITTPFAHADKIKNMMLYSLPANYYSSLLLTIDSLSEKNLQEAAQKYFNEESFSVVAVG